MCSVKVCVDIYFDLGAFALLFQRPDMNLTRKSCWSIII